ncbi:OB-fold domain-containing protein [bacterium]|nr:OB-fold domain-containing protein [bacterium]
MPETPRPRQPIKPGFFTVPDDPAQPPKLLGTRCEDCGEFFYPRRALCGKCMSRRTVEVELDARGTLYSYTFVHLPLFGSTNMEHADGYGVGQIDLPEGPRVQAPLAGKQPEFQVGQTVQGELDVLRDDGGTDIMIIRFRPLGEARP